MERHPTRCPTTPASRWKVASRWRRLRRPSLDTASKTPGSGTRYGGTTRGLGRWGSVVASSSSGASVLEPRSRSSLSSTTRRSAAVTTTRTTNCYRLSTAK